MLIKQIKRTSVHWALTDLNINGSRQSAVGNWVNKVRLSWIKVWESSSIRAPKGLYTIIFTHLKLCLADATHNFRWVKIVQIISKYMSFISTSRLFRRHCEHFVDLSKTVPSFQSKKNAYACHWFLEGYVYRNNRGPLITVDLNSGCQGTTLSSASVRIFSLRAAFKQRPGCKYCNLTPKNPDA